MKRMGDEHGGRVRIKKQLNTSLTGARRGIQKVEQVEKLLNEAGIATNSYIS